MLWKSCNCDIPIQDDLVLTETEKNTSKLARASRFGYCLHFTLPYPYDLFTLEMVVTGRTAEEENSCFSSPSMHVLSLLNRPHLVSIMMSGQLCR
jgi:hypothetical protein